MPAASTVRFAKLVAQGGTPEVHLSWVAPAKDRELQRAAKQHRLVTVHQRARGPKDYGVVGLETAPDAQYLVFPKSLRAFAGRKVIGIKYEMLEDAADGSVRSTDTGKREKPKRAQKQTSASKRRSATKPPAPAAGEVETEAVFITDTDPVKREARQALIALSAGRVAEAKRHLQAILARDERG